MAIQNRRGEYEDFVPSKLKSGEWAVVTSGDSNATDGTSVYMCFTPGDVKRMATYEDAETIINNATSDIKDTLTEEVNAATEQATTAAKNADAKATSAETAAKTATAAAKNANDAVTAIKNASAGTLINDTTASGTTVYSSQKVESRLSEKLDVDGDASDTTVAFTAASSRTALKTGETLDTLTGKTAKWLNDLKTGAFRSVSNALTVSSSGSSVLDAYQGKVLKDAIDSNGKTVSEINTALANGNLGGVRYKYENITLSYSSSTRMQGNMYCGANVLSAQATMLYQASTPYTQVDRIWIHVQSYDTGSRLDVFAEGSGFVSGHVLKVAVLAVTEETDTISGGGSSGGDSGSGGGTYDDTEVRELISANKINISNLTDTVTEDEQKIAANTTAIATLNGTGTGSVYETVTNAIAEIVADAPDSFDTLKEISDWISSHENDVATMNVNINANTAARHKHTNKDVLDKISGMDVQNWNNAANTMPVYVFFTDEGSGVYSCDTDISIIESSWRYQPILAYVPFDYSGTSYEAVLYFTEMDYNGNYIFSGVADCGGELVFLKMYGSDGDWMFDANAIGSGGSGGSVSIFGATLTDGIVVADSGSTFAALTLAYNAKKMCFLKMVNPKVVGTSDPLIMPLVNYADSGATFCSYYNGQMITAVWSTGNYFTVTESSSGTVPTAEIEANTAARHTHDNKTVLDGITAAKVSAWDNKSDFSGSYNDLTNKPTIPTVPTSLKNPYKLTFTGTSTASYDGSSAVTVNIPTGGAKIFTAQSDSSGNIMLNNGQTYDDLIIAYEAGTPCYLQITGYPNVTYPALLPMYVYNSENNFVMFSATGTSDGTSILTLTATWYSSDDVVANLAYTESDAISLTAETGDSNAISLTAETESASGYTLPTATASVLGGVKIGAGVTISNGVISLDQDWLTTFIKSVIEDGSEVSY